MERDARGRFVKTEYGKENKNEKENRTMTKREERMEALKAQGVNTDGMFDVTVKAPIGAEIKILVNGKEMTVPSNFYTETIKQFVSSKGSLVDEENVEFIQSLRNSIGYNGYVKNTKLWRRWVTAQTFRMLDYEGWRYEKNRDGQYEKVYTKGFDAALRNYDYYYQFRVLKDELHVQTQLWKADKEVYRERNQFFSKKVVIDTCNHYLKNLKKYVRENTRQNGKGDTFVILSRYGKVNTRDLYDRVYSKIKLAIDRIGWSVDPRALEEAFEKFLVVYNKIPYDMPKCSEWKTAFKASGAFYTLKNLYMFHGLPFEGQNYSVEEKLRLLNSKAKAYAGSDGWRLHEFLKAEIERNNFNLCRSIRRINEENCSR